MEQIAEEYLSKDKLNEIVYSKQTEMVLNKIIEAAKNFKNEVHIVADYALRESTIGRIKKLGYKIEGVCHIETHPYRYTYRITW